MDLYSLDTATCSTLTYMYFDFSCLKFVRTSYYDIFVIVNLNINERVLAMNGNGTAPSTQRSH